MPGQCTPTPTATVYRTFESEGNTLQTVISSEPVVAADSVTVFPTATVACSPPEQDEVTRRGRADSDSITFGHASATDLIGNLSLPFKKRAPPAACTPQTLFGSSVVKGGTSFSLHTIVISRGSKFLTSTPVSTLFKECEETPVATSTPSVTSSSSSSTEPSSAAELTQSSQTSTSASSDTTSDSTETEQARSNTDELASTSFTTLTSSRWQTVTQSGMSSSFGSLLEASHTANANSTKAAENDGNAGRVGAIAGSALGAVAGVLILIIVARYIYRYVSNKAAGSDVDSLFDFSSSNHNDLNDDDQTGRNSPSSMNKDAPLMRESSNKSYAPYKIDTVITPPTLYDPNQFYVPSRPSHDRQYSDHTLQRLSKQPSGHQESSTNQSTENNSNIAGVGQPNFDAHASVYSSISGGRRIVSSYFDNTANPAMALAPPLPTRFNPYRDEAHSPVPQSVGAVNRGSVDLPKGILKVRNLESTNGHSNAQDPYAAIGR